MLAEALYSGFSETDAEDILNDNGEADMIDHRAALRAIEKALALSPPEDQAGWREPYRSRDAAGSPEAAEAVGWAWIDEIAANEKGIDPAGLRIESPPLAGDGRVIALYRGTKLLACATIFRDQMNFAVLVRWTAPPPPQDR